MFWIFCGIIGFVRFNNFIIYRWVDVGVGFVYDINVFVEVIVLCCFVCWNKNNNKINKKLFLSNKFICIIFKVLCYLLNFSFSVLF